MAASYFNIRSKLDRAIVAYLKSVLPANTRIYPANYSGNKELPHIEVQATKGRPEPAKTGLYRFLVRIVVKFPAAVQPGQNNPEANRVQADIILSTAVDALMQSENNNDLKATATAITTVARALATAGSTQDKANNADMPDFTVEDWFDAGFDGGNPDGDSSSWAELAMFEALCCPSNTD